jgi:hypothetical protein
MEAEEGPALIRPISPSVEGDRLSTDEEEPNPCMESKGGSDGSGEERRKTVLEREMEESPLGISSARQESSKTPCRMTVVLGDRTMVIGAL